MAKILVVDDDEDIFEIIKFTAAQDRHDILRAVNGKDGLEQTLADKPDLIILDIMMPEMDGFTLNTQLSTNPHTKNIPVIILTAKGQLRETLEAAPNVRCYMEKPFEPVVLREEMRKILKNSSKNQSNN